MERNSTRNGIARDCWILHGKNNREKHSQHGSTHIYERLEHKSKISKKILGTDSN